MPLTTSAGPVPTSAAAPTFEQVFDASGEPPWLHYRAEQVDRQGNRHRLEVWRDHDARIRRLTDDRVDVLATRLGGEGDIRFTVADRLRHTATTIDRANLMRLGLFVDWFAQGHALRRPADGYRLTSVSEGSEPQGPAGRRCTVWRLVSPAPAGSALAPAPAPGAAAATPAGATDVCWNEALKLPLWMRDGEGGIVWRLLAVDLEPIGEAVFAAAEGAGVPTDLNPEFAPEAD